MILIALGLLMLAACLVLALLSFFQSSDMEVPPALHIQMIGGGGEEREREREREILGSYAVETVFQFFNGDSSQIHVSWTIFK